MSEMEDLCREVALACRILSWAGLLDQSGHVSVRLPGGEVLINPFSVSRRRVGPADVVTVLPDGSTRGGAGHPPDELAIHTRVYAARPDVRAVAHTHARMATNVTIVGRPLVPVCVHGSLFSPQVPVHAQPDKVCTEVQGDALAKALGDAPAVLIRAHGAVCAGEDVRAAVLLSVFLEDNAERQMQAMQAGGFQQLDPEDCRRLVPTFWKLSSREKVWNHLREEAAAAGYLDGLD